MEAYKRNQIEEAISRVFEPGTAKPSLELRTRIKRLLETDRALRLEDGPARKNAGNFAFFSEESPGTGRDISFSSYEAFAISIGLILMGHGWPQGFAVKILKQVRADLERAHQTILKLDPAPLFDREAALREARPGDILHGSRDPFLLTIVSTRGASSVETSPPIACGVKRGGKEAFEFALGLGPAGGGAYTVFDVVGTAFAVAEALKETKPRSRGRG